jgi:hypothetical protein
VCSAAPQRLPPVLLPRQARSWPPDGLAPSLRNLAYPDFLARPTTGKKLMWTNPGAPYSVS